MYDLRIVVDEVKGFCDLPMRPGDYFEVKGGRITIPEGGHMCLWALQSLLPMLPLKQREIAEENDWVQHTHRMVCPDPNGLVVYRFERIGVESTIAPSSERIPPRLLVNHQVCTGCRSCELACSLQHEHAFVPELARLQVEKDEINGTDHPLACQQCGNAPCVTACPVSALGRDPKTKALTLDREACQSCGSCVAACHFRALRLHPVDQVPLVCDLCGGNPRCVTSCAVGALRYGRAEELAESGRD